MESGEVDGGASLLRRARDEKGWGVKKVAARLTARLREQGVEMGRSQTVTPKMVRAWERGYPNGSRPQARHREQLCALYGKTEAELGIDRASWPWPRHKPAKAPARPRAAAIRLAAVDQARMRYDSDDRAAFGWTTAMSRDLAGHAQPSGEDLEMERQRFLRAMAGLGMGMAAGGPGGVLTPNDFFNLLASGPDSADRVLDATGLPDGTLVDLERRTGELWGAFLRNFTADDPALILPIRMHLGMILHLIDRPEQPAARRRLCSQAAQLNDLLRIAARDFSMPSLARRYGTAAFKAACQAEQPALCAQVLAGGAWLDVGWSTRTLSTSDQPSVTRARMEHGLDLLRQARETGERTASPWTLAQARSLEAEAYATLGRLDDAEASIEAGERVLERARPDDRPFPLVFFDAARFASGKGKAYLRLGMPGLAGAAFREALELHGSRRNVNRATSHLLLTMTHVLQGQLDTALELAGPAHRLASELRVDSVCVIAHELRQTLVPHHHIPEVLALDERLSDLAA